MAVSDDLNRLAAQDVVYQVRSLGGSTELYRGRLRKALDNTWVFNASTGQNGVVGFNLGVVSSNSNSSESPTTGIVVNIFNKLFATSASPRIPPLTESIVLTNVIPAEFTE